MSLFSGHKNHALTVAGYLQEIPEGHAHLGIYNTSLKEGKNEIKQNELLSKVSLINTVT